MSDKQELKPCPFCGGEGEIERLGTPRISTIYKCTNCACSLETGETFNHGYRWNTRHNEFNDKTKCVKLSKDGVADWCMGDAAIESLAEHLKLIKELKDKIVELESRHTEWVSVDEHEKIKSQLKNMEGAYLSAMKELNDTGDLINYPDAWDTACYSTLDSAVSNLLHCGEIAKSLPPQPPEGE